MKNRFDPFLLMMVADANFLISTVILMSIGDYDIYTQFLSALGVRPYGFFFNISLVILAVATFFYYFSLYRGDLPHIQKITIGMGLISSVLLLGIGLFVSGGWTSDYHDLFAVAYFLLLIPLYILAPNLFNNFRKEIRVPLLITGYLTSFLTLSAFLIESVNAYVFQKLIVLSQIIFLFVSSYHMHQKNHHEKLSSKN